MIRPENELDRILDQLRDEHHSVDAPTSLEGRLARHTQQAHRHSTNWFRSHVWGLSFALLAIAAVAGWLLIHLSLRPAQQVEMRTAPRPMQKANAAQTAQPPGPQAQTLRQRTVPSARRPRRSNSVAVENASLERFVRLPTSEGLPEPMQPSFVRMRILTSSLPQYGIDVPPFAPPQYVLAEFVVGEDGLPRAIRLIR